MTDTHPATLQAKKDLETYRSLLADMKAGRRSGGNIDALRPIDKTPEYIELLERKIAELEELIRERHNGPA